MFALLSARLRRWLLFAILLPVLRLVSRKLADRLERKHGPTRTSRVLQRAGNARRKR